MTEEMFDELQEYYCDEDSYDPTDDMSLMCSLTWEHMDTLQQMGDDEAAQQEYYCTVVDPDFPGCDMDEESLMMEYHKVDPWYECWNGEDPELLAFDYYCQNFELISDENSDYHRYG